jgi:hypothetical protein
MTKWNDLAWMDEVDDSTLEVAETEMNNEPEMGEVKLSYGELKDGTELTHEQLEEYAIENPDIAYEVAMETC